MPECPDNSNTSEANDGACGCFGISHEASTPRRAFVGAAGLVALTSLLGGRRASATARQPRATRLGRDYVIDASWALVMVDGAPALRPDVSVRVRDDRVVAVSMTRLRGTMPRLDARGMLLLPGFISGHTHAASGSSTRGLIEGGRSYQRPLELVEQLSDSELDDLTAYNVAELVRSGCTSHVEMSLSLRQAQSYVRVARRWYVRGFPGGMIPGTARLFPIWRRRTDQPLLDSVPDTLAEIDANRRFALSVNGAEDGRIRPMLSPHAADTHTPETLRAIVAAARDVGNGIHTHLAQGAGEVRAVERLWGQRPAAWWHAAGAMDAPFFGAHMTAATSEDWTLLARTGGVYAHCPSAGGAGASGGSQPYPEALAAGVRANIGIDTHSNDYLENLKLAVLYGRARARLLAPPTGSAPRLPTVRDAVDGATIVAAEGLRRTDLGRIAVGAKADLCAIDVSGFFVGSGVPGPEPLHALLYANGSAVQHVVTDGYVQMRHGRLLVDDELAIRRRGGAVMQRLWQQLRDERWFE
jgi:5-methylthioadenosine/S-adenosylhomocysteine deaminase